MRPKSTEPQAHNFIWKTARPAIPARPAPQGEGGLCSEAPLSLPGWDETGWQRTSLCKQMTGHGLPGPPLIASAQRTTYLPGSPEFLTAVFIAGCVRPGTALWPWSSNLWDK